jgi:hypothetical protein
MMMMMMMIIIIITPWSRGILEKLTVPQSRNSPHFMEPGGALPHSQEPATCPILSELNPVHSPIPLLEDPF